jgi:hypothetical protein
MAFPLMPAQVLSLPMFDNVSRLAEDSVVGKTQVCGRPALL